VVLGVVILGIFAFYARLWIAQRMRQDIAEQTTRMQIKQQYIGSCTVATQKRRSPQLEPDTLSNSSSAKSERSIKPCAGLVRKGHCRQAPTKTLSIFRAREKYTVGTGPRLPVLQSPHRVAAATLDQFAASTADGRRRYRGDAGADGAVVDPSSRADSLASVCVVLATSW
jgi:hypothetical protein